MRRVLTSLAVVAACLAAPVYSSAQTLLFDSTPDVDATTVINIDIPAPQDGFSTYLVSEVTFDSAVNITTFSSFFTNLSGSWVGNVNTGVLNIFDGDPLVASDDVTNGGDFGLASVDLNISTDSITGTSGNAVSVLDIEASGLDITLAAGTYFFGLSPTLPTAATAQEFAFQTLAAPGPTSGATFARNPGGGFGLGTDFFDAGDLVGGDFTSVAFASIEGEVVPEPTTAGLLALGLVGLVARRRRS